MSKGKKLGLFALGLLVLIAAAVVVSILNKKGVIGDDSAEESSHYKAPEVEAFFDRSSTDIDTIQIKNKDLTFNLVSSADGVDANGNEKRSWVMQEHPDWELDSSAITSLVSYGSTLKRVAVIKESIADTDLAYFGLKDPAAEVTVTYRDGQQVTVYVGDTTPDGTYNYAYLSDRDGVFTIYKSSGDYARYNLTNLRDITIGSIDTTQELTYLLLEEKDQRPIEIKRVEEEEHDGVYDVSGLRWVQPYTKDEAIVSGDLNDLFTAMQSASIKEVVEADCKDLAKYGLADDDFEQHVKVSTRAEGRKDEAGNPTYTDTTTEYYFGKEAEEGLVYFRMGDSSDVFTMDAAIVDSYDFNCFDYLQKLVFLQEISKIESFSVEGSLNHEKHTVKALRRDVDSTNSAGESTVETLEAYYYDDVLVDASEAKRLYQDLLGISIDYEIFEKPKTDPKDKITITLNRVDGSTYSLEYERLNDFYYVAEFGDDLWVACNVQQIDIMWDRIAAMNELIKE